MPSSTEFASKLERALAQRSMLDRAVFAKRTRNAPFKTRPVDAELCYLPAFLPPREADRLFAWSVSAVAWQQERLTLFGRQLAAPRLTAWYGEAGTSYRYSGVQRRASPWSPCLADLAHSVGEAAAWRFNYVLLNRYRDGSDSLGWHADDESDLGPQPVIATLSVGAERVLRIRQRSGGPSAALDLAHGSLLLMWGNCQRDYKHCVPSVGKPVGERVSFTFRLVGERAVGQGKTASNQARSPARAVSGSTSAAVP